MILGASGMLSFILVVILAYIPTVTTRSLVRKNPDSLNGGHGRLWFYGSKVSLAILTNCFLPLVITIPNLKMRKTVKREIKYFLNNLKD
jgi:hypothetical protein